MTIFVVSIRQRRRCCHRCRHVTILFVENPKTKESTTPLTCANRAHRTGHHFPHPGRPEQCAPSCAAWDACESSTSNLGAFLRLHGKKGKETVFITAKRKGMMCRHISFEYEFVVRVCFIIKRDQSMGKQDMLAHSHNLVYIVKTEKKTKKESGRGERTSTHPHTPTPTPAHHILFPVVSFFFPNSSSRQPFLSCPFFFFFLLFPSFSFFPLFSFLYFAFFSSIFPPNAHIHTHTYTHPQTHTNTMQHPTRTTRRFHRNAAAWRKAGRARTARQRSPCPPQSAARWAPSLGEGIKHF